MLGRKSLLALVSGFALMAGCSQSHPPVEGTAAQIPQRHYLPREDASQKQAQTAAPTDTDSQADDAALLAQKTSEYAHSVSPLLGQGGAAPATQPSVVQWNSPAVKPPGDTLPPASVRPTSNQGAALAAAQFKQDDSLPQILPESADFADTAHPSAAGTVSAGTPTADDETERKMLKMVEDYPQDLGYQFDYELLRLVRDEPTPELSTVAQLTPEDRDLLLALMDGLSNFRNAAKDEGNIMLNRKIQPLLEMADRLRSEAQLSIPTVAFCSQVQSYGVYTPMATSQFPAGRNNDLIVYNDVANFTSIEGSDGIWRTRLQQQMVLYTDNGLAVWPERSNADTFIDQSRNRRHDFFISRLVRLPSSLAAGKYVLKVTLTDEQSNRVVEASSPLEIVGDTQAPQAQPASDQTIGGQGGGDQTGATPDVLSP